MRKKIHLELAEYSAAEEVAFRMLFVGNATKTLSITVPEYHSSMDSEKSFLDTAINSHLIVFFRNYPDDILDAKILFSKKYRQKHIVIDFEKVKKHISSFGVAATVENFSEQLTKLGFDQKANANFHAFVSICICLTYLNK
jgi:hypothetical protein